MYFDTHAHFLSGGVEAAGLLSRAVASGVTRVLAVGGSPELNAGAIAAASSVGAGDLCTVGLALGLDRDQATCADDFVSRTLTWISESQPLLPLAAIGEIGLDYVVSPSPAAVQIALFERQLELAAALSLPVVVHTRGADADTLRVLRNASSSDWFRGRRPGVIHCFTGDDSFAEQLLELGYYLSFSGIVTFRNASSLRSILSRIPRDRILAETDSPYLTPHPLRGRPNEPAYVAHTVACMAEELGIAKEEAAHLTSDNGVRLFALKLSGGEANT